LEVLEGMASSEANIKKSDPNLLKPVQEVLEQICVEICFAFVPLESRGSQTYSSSYLLNGNVFIILLQDETVKNECCK